MRLFFFTAVVCNDMKAILSKLSFIEAKQRKHTQLLQHVREALQQSDRVDSFDIPEGITLPVENTRQLRDLELTLQDDEKARQLVIMFLL